MAKVQSGCRATVEERVTEEAEAKTALAHGQQTAAELEGKAQENSQSGQELKLEVEQLREQLASGEQSAQAGVLPPFLS